jgi:hypothetical protein
VIFPFPQNVLREFKLLVFLLGICRREIDDERRLHDGHLNCAQAVVVTNHPGDLKTINLFQMQITENLVRPNLTIENILPIKKLDSMPV